MRSCKSVSRLCFPALGQRGGRKLNWYFYIFCKLLNLACVVDKKMFAWILPMFLLSHEQENLYSLNNSLHVTRMLPVVINSFFQCKMRGEWSNNFSLIYFPQQRLSNVCITAKYLDIKLYVKQSTTGLQTLNMLMKACESFIGRSVPIRAVSAL